MHEIEDMRDAVELIAQHSEKAFLTRSPFHLQSCGGCGCPSFQQPCSLCSYYPMGADKGTWHPKEANQRLFCDMVEKSGPSHQGGTVATWYIRSRAHFIKNPDVVEALVKEASKLKVPSASDFWEFVTVRNIALHRTYGPGLLDSGWNGMLELKASIDGGYGQAKLDNFIPKMKGVVASWVEANHAQNNDGMLSALNDGIDLCNEVDHAVHKFHSNIHSARRHFNELKSKLELLVIPLPTP